MGRPPLSLATSGKIHVWRELNGQWTARCLYRDLDGRSRPVERSRGTRSAAERALKEALRDRSRIGPDAEIGPESRVKQVAEAWWRDFESRGVSPGTLRLYRGRLDSYVIPPLGNLRVQVSTAPEN